MVEMLYRLEDEIVEPFAAGAYAGTSGGNSVPRMPRPRLSRRRRAGSGRPALGNTLGAGSAMAPTISRRRGRQRPVVTGGGDSRSRSRTRPCRMRCVQRSGAYSHRWPLFRTTRRPVVAVARSGVYRPEREAPALLPLGLFRGRDRHAHLCLRGVHGGTRPAVAVRRAALLRSVRSPRGPVDRAAGLGGRPPGG